MSNNTKVSVIQQILKLKNSVLQFSHLPFTDILSTEALLTIIEHSTSSRERLFTPLVTLQAFIFQVLRQMAPVGKQSAMSWRNGYSKANQPIPSIQGLIVMPENDYLLSR